MRIRIHSLEAIASRLEAIALRLEAVALGLEAIAISNSIEYSLCFLF